MSNNIFDNMKNQMKPETRLIEFTKKEITEVKKPRSRFNTLRYVAAVSSIVLILISVLSVINLTGHNQPTGNQAASESKPADLMADSTNSDSYLKSIPYTELKFPDSSNESQSDNSQTEMYKTTIDVMSFNEDILNNTDVLMKCTVVRSYTKKYNYDLYSDKFEKGGKLHYTNTDIIYELKVDDVLYPKIDFQEDETYKVECPDYPWARLKENRQYILPIGYGDLNIVDPKRKDFAGGYIKKDSSNFIIRYFDPQIEITLDQKYIFHDGWKSLINDKTIDVSRDVNVDLWFDKKFKLRSDSQFISDLKNLILKYN